MSIKSHVNFQQFVQSFCSEDEIRPNLCKPTCYDNGLVVSSDATMLHLFYDERYHDKLPDSTFKYQEGGDYKAGVNALPVVNEYLLNYVNNAESLPLGYIELADFQKKFEEIKMIPEYKHKYKDCEECDGYGQIECECCGQDRDCEECDGEGSITIPSDEVGYYRFPTDECFSINNVPFSFELINKLCESLKLVDVQNVDVYYVGSDRAFLGIKDSGCYILILGINNPDKKKYAIEIKKNK